MPRFPRVSFLLFERLTRMVLGFFLLVVVARFFGPETLGKLTYIFSVTGGLLVLANAGVQEVLIDYIIKDGEGKYEYFISSLILRITASAFSAAICCGIFTYTIIDDHNYLYAAYFSLFAFITPPIELLSVYFSYKGDLQKIALARLLGFFSDGAAKLSAINFDLGLIFLVIGRVLDLSMNCAYLLFYSANNIDMNAFKFSKSLRTYLTKIFISSAPLTITALSSFLLTKMDILMIANLMDTGSVGIYSISARIFDLLLLLPSLIVFSVRPGLLKKNLVSYQRFKFSLMSIMSLIFWVNMTIFVILCIFGRLAVELAFGTSFASAYEPMLILIIGNILISTTLPLSIWQINKGYGHYRLISQSITLICNFLLNYLLIPSFGLVGAAAATSISFLIGILVSMLLFKRQREALVMLLHCPHPRFFLKSWATLNLR